MLKKKNVSLYDGINLTVMDDYIGNIIKKNRNYYEYEVLTNFIDYIPANAVIYDIGANIGNHSIFFSKYLKARKVISFEPCRELYDLVKTNVDNNGLKNIEVYNYAIGDCDGLGSLSVNQENMGASKLIVDEQGDVKIKSLDSLKIETPDFVKIDVEGFELNVLLGMKKILQNNKPGIWIEIFEQHFREVDTILNEHNYVLVDRWLDNYIYLPVDNHSYRLLFELVKNKTIKRCNSEINRLNLLMREKNDEINKLQKKVNEIKNNLLVSREDTLNIFYDLIENYTKQNVVLESNNNKLKQKFDQLQKEYEKLEQEYKQLIETKKQLEGQIQNLNMQLAENELFLKNNSLTKKKTILSNIDLINKLEELTYKFEKQLIEIKLTQDENIKLRSELVKHKKKLDKINKRYQALKNSTLGKITLKYWNLRKKFKYRG